MTAAQSATRTARRAARSGALETLTRIGFIGYGLVHLAVAWLAVQIALGHPGGTGDQSGAFRYLAERPFGRFLLVAIIIGLIAMAVWQLLLAVVGHREERGFSRTAERFASLARAVIYGALAWTAYQVVEGAEPSNAAQQESTTAGLMARPWGHPLVGLAGLIVVAVGLGMIWYGWRKKFERRLMVSRMSARHRGLAAHLGQAGYVAKGVAFGIVGGLLLDAAVSDNPARSRGLDAALHLLVEQPYGALLLMLVAVGFAAFGIYCFFQSRYRKVRP
jgi:hypothetical protein